MLMRKAEAQVLYIDPAVSATQAAHSAIINSQLNATKDKLTLVERGQLAVTGQLGIVNDMQAKIYKGLSQVSSILTNLADVQEISRITIGMTDDINKGLAVAAKNPILLVFAQDQANYFYTRATKLALEVSSFALKGGGDNLMDSGERAKLIHKVLTEMLILRSLTYGMYRAMYYAQMRGVLRSLNPFQGYVNMDEQIMNDILRKRKYLK
ncbi:hypothetical protein HH214_21615 (plasmid) [Mucilaginibacter robiniae]|uniref:Uncharacterized protein n=2 Tax=Mucilaginibacter robiniae TaxID=2728022 RepID=A0A7L5E8A0_9SPHI|nr:hypothetical protein HH214_21615 [Mucilaginibacter robiniae]